MVENTALCNLKCDLCRNRKELLELRGQTSLTAEDVVKIAKLLRDCAIQRVFYFNLGEPFLSRDIADEIEVIRSYNPGIEIVASTNGVLLDVHRRMDAALMMDYIYVSLDGVDQESVERYQVGSDFDRVFANMSALSQRRAELGRTRDGVLLPVLNWKYLVFRWNDSTEQIERAIDLSKRAGFDLLTLCQGDGTWRDKSLKFSCDLSFANLGQMTDNGIVISHRDIPDRLLAP